MSPGFEPLDTRVKSAEQRIQEGRMPTSCAFGSEPQSGAPSTYWISIDDAKEYAGEAGLPWLAPIIWAMSPTLEFTAELCSTDPPTPPAWDVGDFLSFSNPILLVRAVEKLRDYVRWRKWLELCQCKADAECSVGDVFNDQVVRAPDGVLVQPVPAGAASVRFTIEWVSQTGPASDWAYELGFQAGGVGTPFVFVSNQPKNTTVQITEPTPPGVTAATLWVSSKHATGTLTTNQAIRVMACAEGEELDGPPEPERPAGVPDYPGLNSSEECSTEIICENQQTIYQSISSLKDMVRELIANQPSSVPPLASDPEPIAAGEVEVTNVRGVVVEYEVPIWQGSVVGAPPLDLLVGYLSYGTTDGWYPPVNLVHSPQVIDPLPPNVTRIALSLSPGVSGTYTLLEREV